jgi:hypothetical protein
MVQKAKGASDLVPSVSIPHDLGIFVSLHPSQLGQYVLRPKKYGGMRLDRRRRGEGWERELAEVSCCLWAEP